MEVPPAAKQPEILWRTFIRRSCKAGTASGREHGLYAHTKSQDGLLLSCSLALHSSCGITQFTWHHTIHVASHSSFGITQFMWHHTVYVASHSSCGITQFMWHHTIHVASHNSCGITQFMWHHTVHVASHNPSITQPAPQRITRAGFSPTCCKRTYAYDRLCGNIQLGLANIHI
jgi:hypothetical protein